jgi:hypothetical protein
MSRHSSLHRCPDIPLIALSRQPHDPKLLKTVLYMVRVSCGEILAPLPSDRTDRLMHSTEKSRSIIFQLKKDLPCEQKILEDILIMTKFKDLLAADCTLRAVNRVIPEFS